MAKREKEGQVPTIQFTADQLREVLTDVLKNAQQGQSEWQQSMSIENQEKKDNPNVTLPSTEEKQAKVLKAITTGTFLDSKFLGMDDKPIGGIPVGSSSILTGLPNSGKSILFEEMVLRLANAGYKICYVLSEETYRTETERYDAESRLKDKAKIMKLPWLAIAKNLFVLDTVTHAELREWENFASTYRSLVEEKKIDIVFIDSMTLLEDVRGQIKYRVLDLMRYNQLHGITSLLINQRAIEESDSMAMAGGIGISHIVDIVFILDYKKISSWDSQMKQDMGVRQSETVNFFRILKCRLCKFDAHYFGYAITKDGFVVELPKITTDEVEILKKKESKLA